MDIICRKDPVSDTLECDGLVRVEPDDAALRVIIKRLHGKKFKDRHLAVRQYHVRSWQRDPRVKAANSTLNFKERRKGERRRSNLKTFKLKAPLIEGFKVFHRSY
ncbi:hypothetical protein [Thiolapillus sp.]|uniref:hypothetical protein n=1 Tax=Thiolapillus sp. TaxID=2017437 RepID=UPI003AF54653